jgi:hypothetical protein
MKQSFIMLFLAGTLLLCVSTVRCAKNEMEEIEKKCEDDCRRIHRECKKDPSANAKKEGTELSLCDREYFRCIRNRSDYPSPKDPR